MFQVRTEKYAYVEIIWKATKKSIEQESEERGCIEYNIQWSMVFNGKTLKRHVPCLIFVFRLTMVLIFSECCSIVQQIKRVLLVSC